MAERRIAHYSGRVQGVGFRDTTQRIAQRHGVSGTVKNLADGRVEVIVEGPLEEIERFLGELERVMADHVTTRQVRIEPAEGLAPGFSIRF